MTQQLHAAEATTDTVDAEAQATGEASAHRTSPQADLRQSIGWIVFGAIVIVLSWRMDRLERQDINPYTVPGLLPGFLGLAVVLFGSLLLWRSWQRIKASTEAQPAAAAALSSSARSVENVERVEKVERKRIATVLVLCIGYAAGLMGHGLPFWLATSIFVAAAIGVLQFAERTARGQRWRGLIFALVMGIATGIGTTFLFQDLFLVRLP